MSFYEPALFPEATAPMQTNQETLPMTVGEIMTRDVVTVSPRQSLADAMALMSIHRFHHLLVTNSDGKLLGVLSDRDLLGALPGKPDWETYEVSQLMTTNPVTANPDDPLATAAAKMLSLRIHSLPVAAADGAVLGIITSTDMMRHYQRLVETMQTKLKQVGFIEFSL